MEPAKSGSEFDLERIARETFIGRLDYRPVVESTNTVALQFARQGNVADSMLFLASQQTAGRGRGANRWWSAEGSLTFSVLLRAGDFGLTESQWPKASLTAGLSVCCALETIMTGGVFQLKWPNDVHLDGQKVCGVLVEVASRTAELLVIGIGVNVNNSFSAAPADLRERATSLSDRAGRSFERTEILVRVMRQLERQLLRLSGDDRGLAEDWRDRCALRGRVVEVATGTRRASGICQGIDDEGALVLFTETGPVRHFGGVVTRIE